MRSGAWGVIVPQVVLPHLSGRGGGGRRGGGGGDEGGVEGGVRLTGGGALLAAVAVAGAAGPPLQPLPATQPSELGRDSRSRLPA